MVSGAGWDNQFVAGFQPDGMAVGHYRHAVNGAHVMPSSVPWGITDETYQGNLTYTPSGWHFQMLHTLDGEPGPVSATAHYMLCPGDFLDVWGRYRRLPEHQAWEDQPVLPWCQKVKVGGFWHMQSTAEQDEPQLSATHEVAESMDDGYVALGLFAWSLTGDYETEGTFVNESGELTITADYLKHQVAAFQQHERVRLGLYVQGALIERLSKAYKAHPEWALLDADGKPLDSGFRDNKTEGAAMYFFNPLDPTWVRHYMDRVRAVMRTYSPGWLYCDGGAYIETTDHSARRPVLPSTWDGFYRRQLETVRRTDPRQAVLLNAQNFPYGDMYWLECGYFEEHVPWRQTVEFCFDTEILHRPERTILPLYWRDEKRYLAMCVVCGFTPCVSGQVGQWAPDVLRAIDVAYAMRRGEMVLSSRATRPVWWKDDTPVVCFAEKVDDKIVVPILNFGTEQAVDIVVNCAEAGIADRQLKAWLVHPFEVSADEEITAPPEVDRERHFRLSVPHGFDGLRLLVLGDAPLL